MMDRKGSDMSQAGGRGSRRSRWSRFHDGGVQGDSGILPIGKITRRTSAKPPYLQQAGVVHARRLGLLSDRSAPPHVPGPLVSPLIGGLPGSSLLIGQQAACLQLARIKTQLALSQISSAIAAGHQAVASRTVSNTPPYLVSTQAPSPTATAINLLNLLKVANLSHKLYNPYSLESQDYPPYQPPSAQVDPGNVREPSHMVTGSTPASIGASFATSMNPSNIHPAMHPSSMGFIPGQSQPAPEFKGAMNIHIKQAKGSTIWSGESMPSDCPSSSKHAANSPAQYTCESAMDILKRFNLQEEDLEALCAYPDDQLSTANLPCLLRDISQNKANRLSAATSSSMVHQAQGSHCAPETTLGPGADVKRAVIAPSAFQQPIKVIEYGHTSKYNVGIREEEKDRGHHSISVRPRSLIESGLMGSSTSQSRETLQKDLAQAKHGCSLAQRSTNLSPSVYSPLTSVTFPPVATNIIPKRDSSADQAASAASQRPAKGTGHTSHRPALGSGTTSHKATTGPTGTNRHKPATGPGTNRHKPTPGTGSTSQSPAPGAGTTSPRPALGVRTTILRPAPATDPGPIPIPRSIPTNQGPPPASDESIQRPPPVKPADRVPTVAMISDYMGFEPDLFPHTCSLCNKPCAAMKDWLDHKKHKVHRASCQLLSRHSDPEESQQPPTTTTDTASSQSSRPSLQPTSHGGPAPSNSAPPLTRTSVDTKILETGKSRSPQRLRSRSKSSGRKRSRSKSSGRKGSRSKSPQTKRSRSRQTKRAGSKSSGRRRSSSRERSTSSGKANSPHSSRPVHSRSRSRSSTNSSSSSDRYHGKRPSSPARRSRRRSGSPRRGRRSRSHSPWRRTRKSRSGSRSPHPSSQRRRSRSHDGRSSGRRQEETSVEQLAKKLLESSGVQSFTGSSSLELVVQTLAPVLLAELAKLKAASSSSSDSSKEKKPSPSSSSRDEQKQSSSSSRDEKKPSSSSSSRDEQKPSSSSSRDKKKPFSSSSYSDEQKKFCSSSRDEKKPSSSSSYRDEQKQSSSLSRDEKKPPSSSSSRDEKKQSSSSSRDEKKQSSSSSRDEKKPSSSSSSTDEKLSTSSRDEKKPSSSSKDEEKPPSSSSSRDEEKPPSSSSSRDEKKSSFSSSSIAEQKQSASLSSRDEKNPSSSSRDEEKESSSSRDEQKRSSPYIDEQKQSSSSSRDDHKQASSSSTKGGKEPPLSSSSSSASTQEIKKVLVKKSAPTMSSKPQGSGLLGFVPAHPPLLLSGLPSTVTKQQVISAVEKLGKTRFIYLDEHRQEAIVYFLQATAAKALLRFTELKIGGNPITVTQIQKSVSPKLKENQASTKPGSRALPGDKTTTPGDKTTMPGDETTTPGDETTPPGDETTMPGDETTTPGDKTTTPGDKATKPGNETTTPGEKATTPGEKATTPGEKATTPGDKTTTPGDKTTTAGVKTTTAGVKTTTAGVKTTTAGVKTTTAGVKTTTAGVKTTTSGNKKTTTGDETTTPGNRTTTPGHRTITPGNQTTPGDEATTPGDETTTPGDETTTPSNETTTPGDKTTTPGDKTTTPGDKATKPSNETTTPGEKATTPGEKATTPGEKATTPGEKATTPGDKTTTAGDKTTTAGVKTTTAGVKTTTAGVKTTTAGVKTTTSGNKKTTTGDETTTPGNRTTTPGHRTITPGNQTTSGNKKTTPGDEATTPGDETTTPGDETTTPSNKMTTPGDKMTTPGDKTTTPSNKTTTPGDKTTTPGDKTTTPGDKTTTPGDKTTTPGVKSTTPGDKTTTPGDKTTTPGDKTTTPGDKTTTPGDKTTTPGDKTTTPGDKTTTPSDTNVSIVSRIRPPVPRLHPECRISPTVLFLKSIKCIDVRSWSLAEFQPFASRGATMIVTGLPDRARGPYRETEMIRVLEGFSRTKLDKYFILPDNCTAFVEMVANKMERLMDVLANGLPMNGGLLRCHLLKENALRSPIAFYKQLLTWSEKLYDETTLEYRLVYISNIPDDYYWMKAFHEGITKTGGVRVYLPLMGKIFVEFVTGEDADRFGVWLSSFSPDPRVENPVRVTRPGMVPDMDAICPVRTNISHKAVVSGLQPPFWLVVPTRPHLYPTLSPQFYTPAHRTVKGPRDVEWAEISIIGQSVVMVTGLPLGGYRHLDLVNEVVPYFVEMDISRVFYSVVILPLQRRAFIHFDDGLKCKEFVSDFLHKPFTIGGSDLTLHFLLDHLKPCTSELKLYKRLLQWSHVVPKEKASKDQLLMTEIEYCSMRALKFIFDIMETTQYLSCLVLSNRVVFQIPCETDMYNLIANLIVETNDKLVNERSIYFPKPYQFQTRFKFIRSKMVPRRFQGLRKLATTTSGQSAFPHPSAPGQLAASLRTYAPPPAAPAERCASAHDQDWPPGSGPKPTALSQEMYRFFATAIHQHRQARVGQEVGRGGQEVGRGGREVGRGGREVGRGGREVGRGGRKASQEKVTASGEGRSLSQHVGRSQIPPLSSSSSNSSPLSRRSRADGSPPPKRERRGQKETMESKGVSEALIEDPPGLQEEGFKPGKFIVIDEVGDEAEPIVISSYHSEACDPQTRPSHITKEKEVPSDQQVSEEVPRTSSYYSSTSRGVESNTSTTAHSSSLSGATASSSSSSSSLPPPAGVVPSSSEQNTRQKKCEESPAQVSEDDEPNSQEATSMTTTTEVDSLPACKPITKDGSQWEAAMVCEVDMARFGHMLAAETSAVKSAASLTGKDVLHTDPCLEEEGKRKAQQELTLTGKDVVVSPSEDMKENRVEVDETQEQLGDEKSSDQMLHSRPECGEETPHQTPVQPETPGLPDPESQTSEPQEEGMLAKVADEAEPFQEVLLEEEKEAIVEEQTPTVVSEAADALLNGASTEEGDTHQLMDCVEGSPPKKEQENSKDPTEEELTNKRPAVEEGASEMEQRRSKRGNPSHPSPAIKLLSTRHSTPTRKRESPAEDPVVDSEMQEPHDDKQPAAGKRRSGRGRKEEVPVSGTSKMAAKEGQQRVKDNEEEVYQVVDSIEENHQEEAHVNSLGPARRSSLAKTRATRTCSKASKGEEPQYQVGNSKGEQEEHIQVEEQLSEEPLRGKRGRKVTGSDAKTEHEATKKRRTTEQTPTPLPDNQSEARLDSESVVSQEQMVYDEEKDSSSIIGERKQSEGQAASSKARRKERGAEPKTVRSLASSVAKEYTLPPFTPYNPLGMEHVVPKAGFYCNLCSVFYEDETRARTLHCSSLGHYHNLKVFYKKLKEEQSRSQSGDSAPGHSPG
ncbi:mucin-12 isoform X3 [Gadus morhua]|uniref:mucin-12 isoform X3 n=1 Tax=Gadus morhua TaxID=8049 RepID=UPI0011B6CABD|nr:mucin-12-like isoform X3 [Gadus morhua]